MQNIGLLSDTHGFFDPKLYSFFSDVDEIWHAGDIGSEKVSNEIAQFKKLRAVYGNIDDKNIRMIYPESLCFEIEQIKVSIAHIGGYPNHYSPTIMSLIKSFKPTLVIAGHSHILKVLHDKKYNCLYINPGAAGIHGFHQVRTAVKFVIDKDKIKDLYVIELMPRYLSELNKP